MVTNWLSLNWSKGSKGSFLCWMLMLEPIIKGSFLWEGTFELGSLFLFSHLSSWEDHCDDEFYFIFPKGGNKWFSFY